MAPAKEVSREATALARWTRALTGRQAPGHGPAHNQWILAEETNYLKAVIQHNAIITYILE